MNSGRPPITGNFCMGAWTQTEEGAHKLNHFALSWDPTGTRKSRAYHASSKRVSGLRICPAWRLPFTVRENASCVNGPLDGWPRRLVSGHTGREHQSLRHPQLGARQVDFQRQFLRSAGFVFEIVRLADGNTELRRLHRGCRRRQVGAIFSDDAPLHGSTGFPQRGSQARVVG